jgi:serine/threonine protein kinase
VSFLITGSWPLLTSASTSALGKQGQDVAQAQQQARAFEEEIFNISTSPVCLQRSANASFAEKR